MVRYNISKLDDVDKDKYCVRLFNEHDFGLLDYREFYYYQVKGNSFVSTIDIIFGDMNIIKEFKENKIYLFVENSINLNDFRDLIYIFQKEFSNLKYTFVVNENTGVDKLKQLMRMLHVNGEVVDISKYLEKRRQNAKVVNAQYKDYDVKQNQIISGNMEDEKKRQEDIKEAQKNSVGYRGYNMLMQGKSPFRWDRK